MNYSISDLRVVSVRQVGLSTVLRVAADDPTRYIQCYVSGRLAGWQLPRNGTAEFALPALDPQDIVRVLSVEAGDASENLWEPAFAEEPGTGARIAVETPQRLCPHAPDDRWRVYVGRAGEADADALVHEQAFYPAGRGAGGWGSVWGLGGWGWSGAEATGWGHTWGLGEWGFDCRALRWLSEPVPGGTYAVLAAVVDACGNESADAAAEVTVVTRPRAASDATVLVYDPSADTLTIGFAPSPDDPA